MLLNIIHLENRKDRLSILIKEIENQHFRISYKLWPGIKDTQPKTGISLAHKQIVNFAKSKNLPEVAIAEDDLKFTSKRSYLDVLQPKLTNLEYLSSWQQKRVTHTNARI